MYIFIFFVIAFCSKWLSVSAGSCHLREVDLCAATILVFTQNPGGIASSENELKKQCGYLKEAEFCVKNFTRRCTTPLQRELFTFVMEGSDRLMSEYCRKGSQLQRNYLKHSQCLNDVHRTTRMCVKDFQAALEVVSRVEWDKRIPAGCCAYNRYVYCSNNLIESRCGKDAVEFMNLLLRMALSKLPDIICQGYGKDNPECKSLLPARGTKPKGSRSSSILSRLFSAYTGL